MYYYIKGKLIQKDNGFMVVDNNGIGYLINTSLSSLQNAGEVGSDITVYTYLSVREDAHDLFGFTTIEEKNMFLSLVSVSGVGPKAALAILSVASPADIAVAIVTDNTKLITKAAGVGPKLAQRIILELKDKMKNESLDIQADLSPVDTADHLGEAVNALVVLGYSVNDASAAVRGIDNSLGVDEIIKKALAKLF